jgi:hypothetical protein
MNELLRRSDFVFPPLVAAGNKARMRFLEFFTANIRNLHTRRAYGLATQEFLMWCAKMGVSSIDQPW